MRISDWSSDVCCSDLKAHWHVLLRARAIETGCYVVAPAQCGEHAGGRLTYGHSLIIDPWGEVLADGGEEPGFVRAEIDLARIDDARRMNPSPPPDRRHAKPPPAARAAWQAPRHPRPPA